MLRKLSCLLVICIVAFTHGGVLRTTKVHDDDSCSEMYVNCTTNEDCCGFMRCLDFGSGDQCMYGTDNPQIKSVGQAVQPPVDLIKNLGCSLIAQTCETLLDCCAPYVCSRKYLVLRLLKQK
ncbi:Hypothetical predicted protein [Paramuricea clavata]|uniref:Uncharacterized protein n=1 Tax=Paramuricea clavata TaxID=317549 RepID=A0A6S7KAJ3_PARCT|nr:Hypothetical predicted protein [Paramuricea clavata]